MNEARATNDAGEPDAEEVWRGLLVWFESISAGIERDLAASTGLSAAEFQVLGRLWRSPDSAMDQADLLSALHWSPSRLSHLLARMKTRDYVQTDLRGSGTRRRVTLTDVGIRAFDAARVPHADAVRRHLLDTITARHRTELAAAVARATAALEA